MKTVSSLKKLKIRHEDLQTVRRGKRIYVIVKNKKGVKDFNKRFKAKQGY
ncbi:hypothetical protein phytr_4830 [Candidatus Phycorickettsia trachydisci]|uniref:50S ribosomal protein L36 n=1 Tax=Candidatus Phycorickettsia trachydisci TaxID=2115978 RepID=A0A2P1P841_9RICK|nr:hypothetical protein phytr_4830 [Candidatus Phycorickettsia trachydisci]